MKTNHEKLIVAAFDFDGTLTYKDTLLPFLSFITSSFQTSYCLALLLPKLLTCLFHNNYRQLAKEAMLKRILGGMPIEYVRQWGQKFASGPLLQKIRPEGLTKLRWHKEQGHRCLLVSANLDVYLEPWALQAGFNDLLCSRVEADNEGKLTGKLVGLNCWGPEKTRRLHQLLGTKENYVLYAYGDSRGDRPMLELADYPFYRRFDDA